MHDPGGIRTSNPASERPQTHTPLGQWDRPSSQMLPLTFEHEVLTFSTRWHETESNDCVNVCAGLLWTCQHVVDLGMKGIFRLKNYGAEKALGR